MKLVLTGFRPFADNEVNPTTRLAESVELPDDCECVCKVFGVTFRGFERRYLAWLDAEQPDAILNLGLAAGRGVVMPEKVALRFGTEPPRKAPPIELHGPTALESGIDTHRLAARMRKAGIPAHSSLHAGTYLCNFVYYLSLRWLEQYGRPGRALFLHLPHSTEDAARLSVRADRCFPSLPHTMLEEAVRIGAEELLG